ncbi:SRPBCC family protein [Mycetocola zhujimingii]|uniref:SRPBCC family protein n=1 Tax=Mycetocola zhujimingii TaxID=2079792 RepID=UPI000D36B693|nr:SRPBCC family protein [Mycetocola zhujimingii]AWB87718.1 polyketide cyclase [Mycetocola zhujimingii]
MDINSSELTEKTGAQIGAVTRRLSRREVDGESGRVVTISQTYPTSQADLWNAVTTGDRISRWLMPITGDLKVGGHYQLEGNAGGEILECVEPHTLDVTWEYGGDVSWVTARLTGDENSATLEVEHTALVDDADWKQFGPGAVGIGWDSMLLGLALHLTSGASMDPAEAMAWMESPDGIRFMTRSNEAWREANIAAGEKKADADAAAARCLAAYTGVGPDPAEGVAGDVTG